MSLFIAEQVDLRIVTLPENLDPADFLLQRGPNAFREFFDGAMDALEHKLRTMRQKLGPSPTTHQINVAIEEMLLSLARAPRLQSGTSAQSRLREHQVLARLSRQFNVAEEELRLRLSDLRRRSTPRTDQTNASDSPVEIIEPLSALERELLEIILLEPEAVPAAAEVIQIEQLESSIARRIFTRCCELSCAGTTPEFSRLLLEFDEPVVKSLLVDLDEQGRSKTSAEPAAQLRDLLDVFRRQQHGKSLDEQAQGLRESQLGADDELSILNQLIDQERTRQGISSPMEG